MNQNKSIKKGIFALLALTTCLSLCSCGKSEAVTAAEKSVKAIGTVTLDSGSAIESAEKAIAALTAEEKEKFKKQEEFDEIKRRYNELQEDKKVEEAIALIDAIGEVSLESSEKITEAETAYKAISAEFQSKVTNKAKLDEASGTLKALWAAEKERIIAEKTPLFNANYDKVENITWYEHKSMPKYIDTRSYIIPYIAKRNNDYWICIRYNYTGDDWVFWKKMTILADGNKYFKNVGRDTVRDNDNGVVWEYYDQALNIAVDMDDADLKMLRTIADSQETIIRFEGDEHQYDLTVSATDKKIISDTLALYEAFIR